MKYWGKHPHVLPGRGATTRMAKMAFIEKRNEEPGVELICKAVQFAPTNDHD
jgi:hypothetical protein